MKIEHPEDLNKILNKQVIVTQRNSIRVSGKVSSVFIDNTGKKPNKVDIVQDFTRTQRVGKISRKEGQSVATVYFNNISRIEEI